MTKYVFLDGRSRQFRFADSIEDLTEGQISDLQASDAQLFELGIEWEPRQVLSWEPKTIEETKCEETK